MTIWPAQLPRPVRPPTWFAAVALGAVLVVRRVSVLLQRMVRDRVGVIAVAAAALALVMVSSFWAVLTVAGLVGLAFSWFQRGRTRLVGAGVSFVFALTGASVLAVQDCLVVARYEETMKATSGFAPRMAAPRGS